VRTNQSKHNNHIDTNESQSCEQEQIHKPPPNTNRNNQEAKRLKNFYQLRMSITNSITQ